MNDCLRLRFFRSEEHRPARRAIWMMIALAFGSTASGDEGLPVVRLVSGSEGTWITVRQASPWPMTIRCESRAPIESVIVWFADPPVYELASGQEVLVGRTAAAVEPESVKVSWVFGRASAVHDPDVLYQVPLQGEVTCVGGYGEGAFHRGRDFHAVDLACPPGTTVRAARAGVVMEVREDVEQDDDEAVNLVRILHADGTIGSYLHLAHEGVTVSVGERVHAGRPIARTGRTGRMAEPHLHFAVARSDVRDGYRTVPFRFAGLPEPGVPRRGQKIPGHGIEAGRRTPLAAGHGAPGILTDRLRLAASDATPQVNTRQDVARRESER